MELGVNFFLEKLQFSSCQLKSRTSLRAHITTGEVHICKNICAHLEKDLCTFGKRFVNIWIKMRYIWKNICVHLEKKICWGFCNLHLCRHGRIMMLVRVFGGNLWLQGRNTGLQRLLQSQKQIYCFQVYLYPQDWQHNM